MCVLKIYSPRPVLDFFLITVFLNKPIQETVAFKIGPECVCLILLKEYGLYWNFIIIPVEIRSLCKNPPAKDRKMRKSNPQTAKDSKKKISVQFLTKGAGNSPETKGILPLTLIAIVIRYLISA
jgi:hypothetical protein